MKILFILLFAALISSGNNIYAQDTLTILHLNDTHSSLASIGPRTQTLNGTQGGISRIASIIGYSKMTEPNVMTFHSGDASFGDLFFNFYYDVPEFKLLNALGLDAFELGNHEFDLNPYNFTGILSNSFSPDSGFPFLCANINIPDTSAQLQVLKNYVHSYIIKQTGNIKAGIFGLVTPAAVLTSDPGPVEIQDEAATFNTANSIVTTLRNQNCNVIILVSHLGYITDSILASSIPGINVILGGHDHLATPVPHEWINPEGKVTYYVQSLSNYLRIGKMKLLVNGSQVSLLNWTLIPVDTLTPEEPNILAEVNNLIAGIEQNTGPLFTQKICDASADFEELGTNLTQPGDHDTPIGNLVTDAFRWKTNTQIAIEVNGSTAQPLYHGPIVGADLFRVFGYGFNTVNNFGFRLVKFEIKGADLRAGLNACLKDIQYTDEFMPQVSGMNYTYDMNRPDSLRVASIKINGSALNDTAYYSAAGNELLYMVLTAQLNDTLRNVYVYNDSTEFQVLLDYVKTLGPVITPYRRSSVTAGDMKNTFTSAPYQFELLQNYPNPFNPVTAITFTLPKPGNTTLIVYDLLGREVRKLEDGFLSAGRHTVYFNSAGLASGIYFYTLKFNRNVLTGKMCIIK
jgi:5'-nucleotidase